MSNCPQFPQEIIDLIIDLLQDQPETLKQCCLISRSWVLRSQKHLYTNIKIIREEDLSNWEYFFPDPTKSPAVHTRTLVVHGALVEAGEKSWIRAFSGVERLTVKCYCSLDVQSNHSLFPCRTLDSSREEKVYPLVVQLVAACSNTLEYLEVIGCPVLIQTPSELEVAFWPNVYGMVKSVSLLDQTFI